ncbi:hypothetical protein BDN72DRAFT_832249 [Pluteus cervinus]|uniref:Uncharacterized protein n=1 Tax=Pluteus cervinus TaxID=181527 RepID=A0ACD3BEE0_9AGAR|nr:hypothetical protein BDN72DRAFT_832249 [Pluteus cervinus]
MSSLVPPLTADELAILSSPPFAQVEGVVNIRDVGGYPITTSPGRFVRPKIVFRSGEPSRITETGRSQLNAFAVKTVFDLRSAVEVSSSQPVLGDNVTVIRAPVSQQNAYDPVALQIRVQSFEVNEKEAFAKLYDEMLEIGGEAFRVVFLHLRDNPDSPCLVHCTAGKDRTGVFVALLLLLLGVSDDDIIKDYSLTTLGLRPALPHLIARYEKQPIFRDNPTGTINMGKSEPETMKAVLQVIREKYGGVEQYLQTKTNLTAEDLRIIRDNLTTLPA